MFQLTTWVAEFAFESAQFGLAGESNEQDFIRVIHDLSIKAGMRRHM